MIADILKGIDSDEITDDAGWWETSFGASFGREKLIEAQIYEAGLLQRITELEAQLADAKQAARWESDLASQALADLEPYRKDAERYQWQPIETAPKEDGARVLLFGYASTWRSGGADLKQPIIRCGRRENITFSRMVKVEGSDLFRSEDYLSVQWVNDKTYLTDDRLLPPTHWMPLPSAPAIQAKGKQA